MAPLIAWRRIKRRVNPPDVLTVKDRIDVEGPEYKRVAYKRLRALVEGFNGRAKCRLGYGRLTWQGLENVSIHVSLVLIVVYAVAGYSEEVFEELGLEHCQGVERFSSWAFSVVEVSELASDVFGVDGV